LVDVVVVDVRVEHGFDTCFKPEFGIVHLATRFDELGHAHAEDVDGLLLADHDGGCEVGRARRVEALAVKERK